MGNTASQQEDSLRARLEEDPELQRGNFPSDEGRLHELLGTSRRIGYQIYGDETCAPERTILFMHGTPGTRFFFSKSHAAYALRNSVRVLVPERPGFGLSTPHPQRTMHTTVSDVISLLDDLGLDKVHVMGYSAGGPYTLAFARWYPHRCMSVTIISSLSPNVRGVTQGMSMLAKFGYFLSFRYPRVLRRLVRMLSRQAVTECFDKERQDFTQAENERFSEDFEIRRVFAKSTLELYSRACGADAESEDYILMAQDWGFGLDEITGDFRIFVYGGEEDNKCTTGMYRTLVEGMPSGMLKQSLGKGENHLWFYTLFEQGLFDETGLRKVGEC